MRDPIKIIAATFVIVAPLCISLGAKIGALKYEMELRPELVSKQCGYYNMNSGDFVIGPAPYVVPIALPNVEPKKGTKK